MLSPEAESVVQNSFREAHERGHEFATVEHLALMLARDKEIKALLKACEVNTNKLETHLDAYLETELEKIV
ncbi:MAG: hypothetical protein JKY15_00370, partial [Deltaproteobacteria bacterium]|nr:hypothetical protein [Deltaproteobacteria bacterium]